MSNMNYRLNNFVVQPYHKVYASERIAVLTSWYPTNSGAHPEDVSCMVWFPYEELDRNDLESGQAFHWEWYTPDYLLEDGLITTEQYKALCTEIGEELDDLWDAEQAYYASCREEA